MIEGFYFGRFQPPLLKHAEIARDITLINPDMHLTVGIADNLIGLNQENFLSGEETERLFRTMLEYLGQPYISTVIVPLPNQPFIESLRSFFKKCILSSPTLVFSGSPSTIRTCQEISGEYNLEIRVLQDDDFTGPRSRHIRQGLMDNCLSSWKGLVAPRVYNYLIQPEIRQRIVSLSRGEKRPWAKD